MSYELQGQPLVDIFLTIASRDILDPLKDNQKRIGWQAELKETPAYQDMDRKIRDAGIAIKLLRENLPAREKVVETLRGIKSNRMMQFMDHDQSVQKTEEDTLQNILTPYKKIPPQLEEIRRAQYNLLNKARLMKLPVVYNDIIGELKKMEPVIAGLPDKLMKVVNRIKEGLDA